MKTVLTLLGCLIASVLVARGQGVTLELVLEQEQYLPGESLQVKVRISNSSGQTLEFGTTDSWLAFSLEDSRHYVIAPLAPISLKGAFSLESSTVGVKTVDLAPFYDLTRPGRYSVSATVLLPKWNRAVQSKPVLFDVIKGSNVWEKEFGVPGVASETGPEMRRYALVETVHSKQLMLYFRLTDLRDSKVFRIYPLGPMVSFSNAQQQIDKFSNLHVLYQTGGRFFVHCLINPDGVLLVRETFENTDTRPTFRGEKDGRITIAGGTRRFAPGDLPPPMTSTPPADAKRLQP